MPYNEGSSPFKSSNVASGSAQPAVLREYNSALMDHIGTPNRYGEFDRLDKPHYPTLVGDLAVPSSLKVEYINITTGTPISAAEIRAAQVEESLRKQQLEQERAAWETRRNPFRRSYQSRWD